jgi:lauroyl/myristoyl acyltransferase
MITYLFFRIGYFMSTCLPARVGKAIVIFLSDVKYRFSPRDRRAVIANLLHILPPHEHDRIPELSREVFINFGKYLYEFFRFKYLKKDDLGHFISIRGIEHVNEALRRNKGVIILSAHMGNWELGGVLMSLIGYPMVAVALPHKHPWVNAFFNRQRERVGVIVVPSLGAAVRRIFTSLKENKLVALVGDRDFANAGIKVPFLGAQKTMPRGPAVLARRTGAAIVPAFVIRQSDDTHVLEFQPSLPTDLGEEELIHAYTAVIERQIRRDPGQWLMFREFWHE